LSLASVLFVGDFPFAVPCLEFPLPPRTLR